MSIEKEKKKKNFTRFRNEEKITKRKEKILGEVANRILNTEKNSINSHETLFILVFRVSIDIQLMFLRRFNKLNHL